MAIDFIIGALLLLSALVNVLALGAFWMTPSLRTTANRFVINLLIVNLVSCIILAPSLLLNSNIIRNMYSSVASSSAEDVKMPESMRVINKTLTIIADDEVKSIFDIYGADQETLDQEYESRNLIDNSIASNTVEEDVLDIICSNNSCITPKIVFSTKIGQVYKQHEDLQIHEMRSWVLDVAAAIGALSVVLVVGDTWCAVTDPLRYHSRCGSGRAWLLIGSMWTFGIIFGIASSFRTSDSRDGPGQDLPWATDGYLNNNNSYALYNNIFSCTYFICIILMPFSLVCAMYWRIFSEARENGLRMRQNGSSPLLQSALNLAAQQNSTTFHRKEPDQQSHRLSAPATDLIKNSTNEGLTLRIDNEKGDKLVMSSDDIVKDILNQSSLLTCGQLKPISRFDPLSETLHPAPKSPSSAMRRNQSARQLFLYGETITAAETASIEGQTDLLINRSVSNQNEYLLGQSRKLNNDIRHVHSTPDLHKYDQSAEKFVRNSNRLPLADAAVHVPPKALSYMTSIRHRLSNASSLFKYREESRAARISILVVIMFLISYIPFGLLVLTEGHNQLMSKYSQTVWAILTVVLANISSPFIFAYRNKRVRRGVKRLLGLDGRFSDKHLKRHNLSNYNSNLTFKHNANSTTVTKVIKLHNKNSIIIKGKNRSVLQKGPKMTTPTSTPNSSTFAVNDGACTLSKGLSSNCGNTFILEIEKCSNGSLIDDDDNGQFIAAHHQANSANNNSKTNDSSSTNGLGNQQDNNVNHHLHLHPSSFSQFNRNHRHSSSVSSNTIRCDDSALIKEKRSIFKRVCDTSRKLGCGSTSCTAIEHSADV